MYLVDQSTRGRVTVLDSHVQTNLDTDELLKALADDRSGAILRATTEPTTVEELSETCEIPLSTTYRQVKRLESAGILEETTSVDPNGRCAAQYQRAVERLEVEFRDDALRVHVVD